MDKVLIFCALFVCLSFSNQTEAVDEKETKSSIVQPLENSPWDPREEVPINTGTERATPKIEAQT
jgi:hypothetical protein